MLGPQSVKLSEQAADVWLCWGKYVPGAGVAIHSLLPVGDLMPTPSLLQPLLFLPAAMRLYSDGD